MITIRKPWSFSEIGRKENQEDYLFPTNADDHTRVFVLCDGMGGHDNGEVASKTAAVTLGNFLSSASEVDIPSFEIGLAKAYAALDAIDTNSLKKPGTTMTCLCLNENSYLVAHIGDSRIYHIRPSLFNPKSGEGGIIYKSSDHSLVNDLLKAGEITEEEARVFPQRNVITRAMQPHLEKKYKADVFLFDDIEAGDYFFICCDGVLEQLSDENLCRILAQRDLSDAQKIEAIKAVCDGKTRDNYSCWLIPIDKVKIEKASSNSSATAPEIKPIILDVEHDHSPAAVQPRNKKKYISIKIPVPQFKFSKPKSVKKLIGRICLWLIVLLVLLGIFWAVKTVFFKKDRDISKGKELIETELLELRDT